MSDEVERQRWITLAVKRHIVEERIQHLLGVKMSAEQRDELERFVSDVVDQEYVIRPVTELMKWELSNERDEGRD